MSRAVQVESLWNGLRDNSGNVLAGGKVYAYAAGTTTDKALFTASDKSSSATQPLTLDAYGRAQVWADGAYKFVVKTSAESTLYTLDNLVYGYDDGEIIYGSTSGGTGNVQTISVSGSITAYAAGQRYIFIAGNNNSGSATLNVNSIGAVSIVKGEASVGLSDGDIRSGQVVDVVYDSGGGGRFRLMSPISTYVFQNATYIWGGTSTGSANAQSAVFTPAITSYLSGSVLRFIPGYTNTAALTFNAGGGATTCLYMGKACVGGEMVAGVPCQLVYSSGNFHILNHGGGFATWVPEGSGAFPTSLTISKANYQRHGDSVYIDVDVNATTTSTTSSCIITLPINASSATGMLPASLFDGGVKGGFAAVATATTLGVFKYDASNFTSGVATAIRCQGLYRA